jgi:hypothetical protein
MDASTEPTRPCEEQWGDVNVRWAPGVRMLRWQGAGADDPKRPPFRPYLNAVAESVEAITSDDRVISCCLDCMRYSCKDDGGLLQTIRVSHAGRVFETSADSDPFDECGGSEPLIIDVH